MKSNWIKLPMANTPEAKQSDIERKIQGLIEWYNEIATRREDDYIKANLKSIIHLAENIENSDDIMFIEKIIDTFIDMIKKQREVIRDLEDEAYFQTLSSPNTLNYIPLTEIPIEEFINDEQIKEVFSAYMKDIGRSGFTTSDYILRVQNLWYCFEDEYINGTLGEDLRQLLIKEKTSSDTPLLNAYYHLEALNKYVAQKIEEDVENSRNWANIRASLNAFGKATLGDEYKKVKSPPQERSQKDFSKYQFNEEIYGKSRLVLAVVKKYVSDFNPLTFEELKNAFPDELQGSHGVVRLIDSVSDKYKGIGGMKRYFVNENEIIHLPSHEQVIVSSQWGDNIQRFLTHVMYKVGYAIKKV